MENAISIYDATRALFTVDVKKPGKTRKALNDFRKAVYKDPIHASAIEFFLAVKDSLIEIEAKIAQENGKPYDTTGLINSMAEVAEHLENNPLPHPFHNNAHILCVTGIGTVLHLINHENRWGSAWAAKEYYELVVDILTRFNHDTDHEGRPNKTNIELELKAHNFLEPYLDIHGVREETSKDILLETIATDPEVGATIVGYAAVFHNISASGTLYQPFEKICGRIENVQDKGKQELLFELLHRAVKDREFAVRLARIRTADMAASFGFSLRNNKIDSKNAEKERQDAKQSGGLSSDDPAVRKLEVTYMFLGASEDACVGKDGRRRIHASFPDPDGNTLLGSALRRIEERNLRKLGDRADIVEARLRHNYTSEIPAYMQRHHKKLPKLYI